MATKAIERVSINNAEKSKPLGEWKLSLADYGRRRHLSYTMDFDTRAYFLEEPGEGWTEEARHLHAQNRERVKAGLAREFGEEQLDKKIENFVALGVNTFSILAYHNDFFDQARRAFVMGAYYPALVGACALGERILNHLVLDLRDFYKSTPEYKRVYRKRSFDNWQLQIDTLAAWGVLLPNAVSEFQSLMKLRNDSIHFNPSTYVTLRDVALSAIHHMRKIIEEQFTAFDNRPWFIEGTKGHIFIKRDWEENPFIKTYYLATCPFLGPYFAISFQHGLIFYDHADYGDGDWTDEEFAALFEARSPEQLAKST